MPISSIPEDPVTEVRSQQTFFKYEKNSWNYQPDVDPHKETMQLGQNYMIKRAEHEKSGKLEEQDAAYLTSLKQNGWEPNPKKRRVYQWDTLLWMPI